MVGRSTGYALAALFLAVAALAAAAYWWSPHATIRITVGQVGGPVERFVAALVAVSKIQHPRVRFEPVTVNTLKESSAQIEARRADLAIVRADVSPPANGQTIAILRRDAVGFLLLPAAKVDSIAGLGGRTVLLIAGRTEDDNAALLDTVLGYYNVVPASVHRRVVTMADLSKAVRDHHVAAVLAIGPIGPGELTDAVATITKAVGAPSLLAFDDVDAFADRNPGFESVDVPKGGLRGRPEIPDDTVTTLAVTYRLVAPFSMPNLEAGAILRSLLAAKSKLAEVSPLAAYIEAPDPDQKTTILPVHPGVADYLSSGEESFLSELQSYGYGLAVLFSVLASAWAMLTGYFSRRRAKRDLDHVSRFVGIAEEARRAAADDLPRLETELHDAVAYLVAHGIADQGPTVALAASHARAALVARRAELQAMGVAVAAVRQPEPAPT